MLIDFATVHSLELVSNVADPKGKKGESLLGLLDNTVTGMGARLVRMNVLQPSTEGEVLEKRLDAVEELTKGEDMFFAGREALKGMPDMDRLCTQVSSRCVLGWGEANWGTVDYDSSEGEFETFGAEHQ